MTAANMEFLWQWKWQWHGLETYREVDHYGKVRRVVYIVADVCKAPDETSARAIFRSKYPNARDMGFFCIGVVEPKKKRKR